MSTNEGYGGAGQIRPYDWTPTHAQIRPFEGFAPEEVSPRDIENPVAGAGHTLVLAAPRPWAQRDDLPCLGRWEEFDVSRAGNDNPRERAARLCEGCPVLLECLSSAMEEEVGECGQPVGHQYRAGIRGGMTPHQRAALGNKMVTTRKHAGAPPYDDGTGSAVG